MSESVAERVIDSLTLRSKILVRVPSCRRMKVTQITYYAVAEIYPIASWRYWFHCLSEKIKLKKKLENLAKYFRTSDF